MKLKVPSKNYRAAYWFSLPFAYKRKRECEVSPHVGEVARSARGAGLAQHITACYKHDVMFCAELTTEQSIITLRAGAQLYVSKELKWCGGKREFSPTCGILPRLNYPPKQSSGLFGKRRLSV